jgi:mannose-6-phosphate isomerase-like protein (cupin superfamily)
MSYVANVVTLTRENPNFRKVLFTGKKSQLVAMRVPPGGEIGEEVHAHVEQTLFVLEGEGLAVLDGEGTPAGAGSVIVVTPGTRHNVKNAGSGDLVLYTVYAPPNHIDGRVHATKAEADADDEDEAFGEANA